MAEYMNADSDRSARRVYIGFHSNAGGGRGARRADRRRRAERTPHQADLATATLGRQINQDMQALNGAVRAQLEHRHHAHVHAASSARSTSAPTPRWTRRSSRSRSTTASRTRAIMRDPKVRDQIARSTYQATLEYFDNWGGLTSPVSLPAAPTNVRAVSNASGEVTLNWAAGPARRRRQRRRRHRLPRLRLDQRLRLRRRHGRRRRRHDHRHASPASIPTLPLLLQGRRRSTPAASRTRVRSRSPPCRAAARSRC